MDSFSVIINKVKEEQNRLREQRKQPKENKDEVYETEACDIFGLNERGDPFASP